MPFETLLPIIAVLFLAATYCLWAKHHGTAYFISAIGMAIIAIFG